MGNPALHAFILAAAEVADSSAAAANSSAASAPDLPLFSIVIFLVMIGILVKFAWGPIRTSLDDREATLASQLDGAREQHDAAVRHLAEQEERLAGVKTEIEALLAKSRDDAESQKQTILTEARQAAESEKRRAIREIDAAKNNALQELADQSVGTAVDLAGRIVGKQLSKKDHANLIEESLKQFKQSANKN